MTFCGAPRPSPGPGAHFIFGAKRQKGHLERIAKARAHDSIPVAAAGRPDGDDTAAAPVGSGAWHCRKWSPEAKSAAKNGQASCQKGHLDGCTESDSSEQNNAMRSHGAQIDFTGFASGAAPPKTVTGGRDSASRPPYGSCRGQPSLWPMAASQRLRQTCRTAMILQPHLSERVPDTAESGPLAAIRVV